MIDPVKGPGRNEGCWCGSGRKYKVCHGVHRPGSIPGAPAPDDHDGLVHLSPSTSIAMKTLASMTSGTMLTAPAEHPAPAPIVYTSWDDVLAGHMREQDDSVDLERLARLRVEVLERLTRLPATEDFPDDDTVQGVFDLAALTVAAVAQLPLRTPRPVVLWNEELPVEVFLGRTLLLADHVLYPDTVFDVILRQGHCRALREAAQEQLNHRHLIASGAAIPVPPQVAAVYGQQTLELTRQDLSKADLVAWVRDQLILEGPTARNAMFVRAADDLDPHARDFFLHAPIRPEDIDEEAGTVTSLLLQPYDPTYDYGPWTEHVRRQAVGSYVQRTNARLVAADVFGSEYVTGSLFEARLMRMRAATDGIRASQAAMFADIPVLGSLRSPDLAKLLSQESAIDDLRRRTHAALATARTDAEKTDALTQLAHDLEASSHLLAKQAGTDRAWKVALPSGLGVASMTIGAVTGGLPALLGGAVGLLAGLSSAASDRLGRRHDAAYLFVTAHRRTSRR